MKNVHYHKRGLCIDQLEPLKRELIKNNIINVYDIVFKFSIFEENIHEVTLVGDTSITFRSDYLVHTESLWDEIMSYIDDFIKRSVKPIPSL